MDKGLFYSKGVFIFYFTSLLIGCTFQVVNGTKCFKDDSVGDREGNTYFCEDADEPECCEEDGMFTCCEDTSKKTLREQLILWGCVVGVGLLISVVCCYFWKDNICGKDDTPLSQKCCCCRKKPEDKKALTPIPEPGSSKSFSPSPWKNTDNFSASDYNRETPPPTFKYKSPTYKQY